MSSCKSIIFRSFFLSCLAAGAMLVSCSQDDYYLDGGKADPDFDGTMMEYLESKPGEFDSIATIVKLARLERAFQEDDITFFAPSDRDIKNLIGHLGTLGLNWYLYDIGKDTVQTLADIDSLIWKKYLERHLFRGSNRLADYSQIDFDLKQIYPGDNYFSLNNTILNIGVVHHDANGVKYAGYRQLTISYIPDVSNPNDSWFTVPVSSSDIKPLNGVVHTLSKELEGTILSTKFGFNMFEFFNDVARTR